jgi:ADP-ribose pyrophosphatase YjhB (NUDIX family)
MSTERRPEIQLIVNLVVHDSDGRVLLVEGNTEGERWALPGWELEPYEHPDDGVRQLLDDYLGLPDASASLAFVDSFRGRRGWHVTFNYRAEASGETSCERPTDWFELADFPRTVHGRWERDVVVKALPRSGAPSAPN